MIVEEILPWDDPSDIISNEQQQEKPLEGHIDLTEPVQPSDLILTPTEDESIRLWKGLVQYHEMGLSMIWGRAEKEITKTDIKKEKTPIVSTWSSEPEARLSLSALAQMMHKAKPGLKLAPIIICGKASGNLYAIDIDNKHWPGIDARYFKSIIDLYPTLWPRLRIHKTPSGGFHILYRLLEHLIVMNKSNPKLAWKEGEKEAGIEMRTHGGYIMSPPGMGYTVYQDVPIPTITVEEHNALIELAVLLNEKITVKEVRSTKTYESIYNENPFQHYNSSPAAEKILENNGWSLYKETDGFIHFTRPGKDTGVSGSFIKAKRLYHVFSSSTDLEPETYTPAYLRAKLEFQGDYKKMYPVLVKEGFGRHKPEYEAKLIRKLVETGKAPPPNLSPEANEALTLAISLKDQTYPHGIYWEYNQNNDSYSVQRELLKRFCYSIGLRLYRGQPCIIEGQFVRKLKESKKSNGDRDVYDMIKDWIREEEEPIYLKISHDFDKFWQGAGEHVVTTLRKLDETQILKSNTKTCYKFFSNKIVEITADGIDEVDYETRMDKLIWADEVIDREWNYVGQEVQDQCMFGDFLSKAVGGNPAYVRLVLGYLCCGYKVKSESYLIAFMEGLAVSKGGGTGKNFLFEMLGLWIGALTINGMAVKKDVDQLIQSWTGEPLVHLSDLPKWVNLSDLKNVVSDNSQRKVLWQNIANVRAEDMPKFVISGQFGLNTEDDGGVKGRVRQLSFTDYFSRLGRDIRGEYGGDCPEVWDEGARKDKQDWNGYYSYLADSVKEYMGVRRLPVVDDMVLWRKGWDIRFSGGESWLGDAIELKYEDWAKLDYVTGIQRGDWYEDVCRSCNIPMSARLKGGNSRLSQALKEYGEKTELFRYETGGREYVDGKQEYVVRIVLLGDKDEGDKDEGDKNMPF